MKFPDVGYAEVVSPDRPRPNYSKQVKPPTYLHALVSAGPVAHLYSTLVWLSAIQFICAPHIGGNKQSIGLLRGARKAQTRHTATHFPGAGSGRAY